MFILMYRKKFIKFLVLGFMIISQLHLATAYNDVDGIELNDVVDVAFVAYRACIFEVEYTSESPFRVEVNPAYINENFSEELLGMKLGEIKPYISWREDGDLIEYYNTTIVNIVDEILPTTTTTPTTTPTNASDLLSCLVSLAVIFVLAKSKKK